MLLLQRRNLSEGDRQFSSYFSCHIIRETESKNSLAAFSRQQEEVSCLVCPPLLAPPICPFLPTDRRHPSRNTFPPNINGLLPPFSPFAGCCSKCSAEDAFGLDFCVSGSHISHIWHGIREQKKERERTCNKLRPPAPEKGHIWRTNNGPS